MNWFLFNQFHSVHTVLKIHPQAKFLSRWVPEVINKNFFLGIHFERIKRPFQAFSELYSFELCTFFNFWITSRNISVSFSYIKTDVFYCFFILCVISCNFEFHTFFLCQTEYSDSWRPLENFHDFIHKCDFTFSLTSYAMFISAEIRT